MKRFRAYLTEDSSSDKLPHIYLDMDETIVDFFGGANDALKKHGQPLWDDPAWKKHDGKKEQQIKWSILNKSSDFWENLRFSQDGIKIWNFVKKYKPSILSACGDYSPNCKKGKKVWINKHLGLNNLTDIHLVNRSEKKNFATNTSGEKNVLIDDYDKNCAEFVSAGGIAIKATTASEVISKLKKLGFK